MSIEAAKVCIKHAQADLEQALIELETIPPEPLAIVSTPAEFDEALAAAVPGDTIICATSLQYASPLTIRASTITIRSEVEGIGRMTADTPAPWFSDQVTLEGHDITLVGLQLTNSRLVDVLVLEGAGAVIDRCRILGDPTQGTKRGVNMNAPDVTITRCHVEYCFGPYPGNDTQALFAADSPGPFLIEDNFLSGGSETIMFGGDSPSSDANIPANITIRNNTITKRTEWQTQPVGVKNTFELKCAKRVLIENNQFSQSWGGHGQDGYLLMLTPRNQYGSTPYCTVEDVEIRNNHFACAAAPICMMGDDNNYPSQRLSRINIHHNRFEALDPKQYTGSNKMILIQRGPVDVTINANEFLGVNLTSQVYFDGQPQCVNLVVTSNKWPHTTYGIFGSNCSTGNDANGLPRAWNKYVQSGTLSNNTEWPTTRSAWQRACEWWLRLIAPFSTSPTRGIMPPKTRRR